jgi:preprotein translocase subunit SecA
MLQRRHIPHNVLNAKNHQSEAEIVARAGQRGSLTIATNMAGRGTDIQLGEGVVGLGGLHIMGTERHESRRIDNQLRGRAGRQGDPGTTQFFVSLEDSLMRVFASDMIKRVMGTFKIAEDEPIYNSMITRSLEKAQTRIEEMNFDSRKHVLAYDDVLNIQRQSIYTRRRALLIGDDSEIDRELAEIAAGDDSFARAIEGSKSRLGEFFYPSVRRALLQGLDFLWVEHLEAMEYLRSSVNLRAYGQRDPLVEYKKEGLKLFRDMELTYAEQAKGVVANMGLQQPPVAAQSSVIHTAARSISATSIPTTKKEYERNDRITITNGTETMEMKYKKAEALLATGQWRIVER